MSQGVVRFAPSPTGPAHPGTMLAALLAWLDARSRGDAVHLRIEDLDPDRAKPEWTGQLIAAFEWMGLDWDGRSMQSELGEAHEAALDRLASLGVLYPCACTRKGLRERALPGADGHLVYPGTCRDRALPSAEAGGWRATSEPLRVRLPEGRISPVDEGGLDLSGDPSRDFGDPIVRRRDGAVAYQLAGVVDDAHIGVTRVVRGHDLAPSTATQYALASLLDLEHPIYRHHLLLLEPQGGKLAKLHGSVGFDAIRAHMDGAIFVGLLAHALGLTETSAPLRPTKLVADFDWKRVRRADLVATWDADEGELGFDL